MRNKWNQLALSGIVATGLSAFAVPAVAAIAGCEHRPSDDVQIAQVQLSNDGLYSGPITGMENHRTRVALRRFQRNNELRVNGRLDRQTRDAMGMSRACPSVAY